MRRKLTQRQLAGELGVSPSYLSQVKHGKRPASQRVLGRIDTEKLSKSVKQHYPEISDTRTETGGSEWESNPPRTLSMPLNGFEAREAHRDPFAPPHCPGQSSIDDDAALRKSRIRAEEAARC